MYKRQEYGISAPAFSGLEALVLIPTFFIFAFNSLADVIGRRLTILLLVLGLGLSCLAILLWTPTLPWFLFFYAAATFFTVSNLWTVPASEEAPAVRRARLVALVYVIGQLPLTAILPPLLVGKLVGAGDGRVTAVVPGQRADLMRRTVDLGMDPQALHVFDKDSGKRIPV